jgi:phosphatidylglycerophosphatase B
VFIGVPLLILAPAKPLTSIKPLLLISLLVYAMLVCAVWLFYPEFTACSRDSLWCTFCYWTTQSAGRFGTIYVVIAACVYFAAGQVTARGKALVFIRSLLALVVILSAFAYLNEHLIKSTLRIVRPSHTFMVKDTEFNSKLDSIYNLTDNNKRAFFKSVITADTITFKTIDERILNHWVEEMGYSFPSGHSFNAFLLAGIIAVGIFQNTPKRRRWLCVIPLVWASLVALSRVAIGAHSALDVSVGSAMGLILSYSLMSFRITRELIIPGKSVT